MRHCDTIDSTYGAKLNRRMGATAALKADRQFKFEHLTEYFFLGFFALLSTGLLFLLLSDQDPELLSDSPIVAPFTQFGETTLNGSSTRVDLNSFIREKIEKSSPTADSSVIAAAIDKIAKREGYDALLLTALARTRTNFGALKAKREDDQAGLLLLSRELGLKYATLSGYSWDSNKFNTNLEYNLRLSVRTLVALEKQHEGNRASALEAFILNSESKRTGGTLSLGRIRTEVKEALQLHRSWTSEYRSRQ